VAQALSSSCGTQQHASRPRGMATCPISSLLRLRFHPHLGCRIADRNCCDVVRPRATTSMLASLGWGSGLPSSRVRGSTSACPPCDVTFCPFVCPGYDALGFISCTGTNFLSRAAALREVGGSPTYTLTEDFALGMELKKCGWHCRYVQEYLAIGEAPDQIRNCYQQRSRWCKARAPSSIPARG
jgi:Glycosyl transferase family group 2